MRVGEGTDVTDHNDIWLKISAPLFYGEKENGHRVSPRPNCESNPDFDCPNGNSADGFFKVYGQDLKFIWQANTSDNDGHEILAHFDKSGDYAISINARSSFCHLDRIALFYTEKSNLADATDINRSASESIFPQRKTKVSIVGQQFHINGKPSYQDRIYKKNKIEGLLLNARLVQGIFDDLNPETRQSFIYPDTKKWDAGALFYMDESRGLFVYGKRIPTFKRRRSYSFRKDRKHQKLDF
ncbi:MAG: hypothetical protein ACI85O_001135 [Saprospiraceae bacterium]|jgi:hypothetical protein